MTKIAKTDASDGKKRKFSRKVLHSRRCKKLMKCPHARVAIRPGRCASFFKLQTSALKNDAIKHKKIYTADLGDVTRMGCHANLLFAQMIEKNLSNICEAIKKHSTHAKRTTVKTADFKLYLSQI